MPRIDVFDMTLQEVPYASTGCGAASVKLLQVNAMQPGPGIPPGADS